MGGYASSSFPVISGSGWCSSHGITLLCLPCSASTAPDDGGSSREEPGTQAAQGCCIAKYWPAWPTPEVDGCPGREE